MYCQFAMCFLIKLCDNMYNENGAKLIPQLILQLFSRVRSVDYIGKTCHHMSYSLICEF